MGCPDEQEILDFVEHRLPLAERARIDVHLDECARCQAAAAELVAALDADVREVFADRYLVERVLGSGAMGVVYSAFDRVLERRVAVKVLHRAQADRASEDSVWAGIGRASERGLREARALARLSHPNIVDVFDVGTCSQGLFIAMELVDGRTLRQWWSDRPRRVTAVVALMRAAADALAAAHAHGIIHRDFKPDNVMVDDGRVKVLDFGLARHEDLAATMPAVALEWLEDGGTRTGIVVGTPAYLAPECHEGGRADARSDQYSFFVTLFEALCTTRPFVGASFNELEILKRRGIAIDGAVWTSRVPRWLKDVVVRGLDPDPARRFADMHEVERVLHRGQARRARGLLLGVAVAAILGAAFVISTPPKPCTRDGLSEVWNDERRTIVSRSLAERAPARQHEIDALDDFAAEWTASYAELCTATSGNPRADEPWATCLLTQRAAMDELVGLLADPEIDPGDARLSAEALPEVSSCTVANDDAAPPELRELLARAGVLEKSGRYDALAQLCTELIELARAAAAPRVEVDALVRLGTALRHLDRYPDAMQAFADAYMVAVRHELDADAADAAIRLSQTSTFDLARAGDGLAWARHAEAALVRAGKDPTHDGHLQLALGDASWALGQLDEALERYALALALAETDGQRGVRHLYMANLLSSLQRTDEAVPHYEQAIEAFVRTRSESHPDTTAARLSFAHSRVLAGDAPRALELVDAAAAQMELSEPTPSERAHERIRRAEVLEALGDREAAIEAQREGIRLTETAMGSEHPVVASHRGTLAKMYRAIGDCERALAEALRARTIMEASATPQATYGARMRHEQAAALRCLGRHAEAVVEQAAAIELLAAAEPSAPELSQWRKELVDGIATGG